MKNIVIFGAGFIGSALARALAGETEHKILALTKTAEHALYLAREFKDLNQISVDWTNVGSLARNEEDTAGVLKRENQFVDSVVCCIGHCPAGGFKEAVNTPLSKINPDTLDEEFKLHVRAPLQIFQAMLPVMRDGGTFTFMGSAATRLLKLPPDKRPPFFMHHHLTALAAQRALIDGFRNDPEVKRRKIGIQHIRPPAIVNSPFHQGAPTPPTSVTAAEVVLAIMQCIEAGGHQDHNFGLVLD